MCCNLLHCTTSSTTTPTLAMPRRPQSPDYEAVLIYSASASSSKSSPQLGGDQYYPSTSSSSPSSHSSDGSEFCYHEEEEDPDYAAYCTYVDEDEYSANELPEENDDAEEKYVVPLPRAPVSSGSGAGELVLMSPGARRLRQRTMGSL